MSNDDRITELITEYEQSLSQWEREFLDSIDNWDGNLTAAQEETLDTIYKRVTRRRL